MGGQDAEELVAKVAEDCFYEGEGVQQIGYGETLSLRFMCPKIRRRDSWILSRSVAERSSLRGKSFISWLYLCTTHSPSASTDARAWRCGEGMRTVICSIHQQ